LGTYLITGVSGYLGARIGKDLVDMGHRVIGLGRKKNLDALSFDYYSLDLSEESCEKQLKVIMLDCSVDGVLHLASLDQKSSEGLEDKVFQVNVLGTQRLLRAMEGFPEIGLIFFSTVHVHGRIGEKVDVDQDKAPLNGYGLTHGLSEDLVRFARRGKGQKTMVLRLSNGYGWSPVMNEQARGLVVNDLVNQAMKDRQLSLKSDGSPVLDFFWIGDLAPLIQNIAQKDDWPEVALLASGRAISLYDLAKKVGEKAVGPPGLPILKDGVFLERPKALRKIEMISNLPECLPGWRSSSLDTGLSELLDLGLMEGR